MFRVIFNTVSRATVRPLVKHEISTRGILTKRLYHDNSLKIEMMNKIKEMEKLASIDFNKANEFAKEHILSKITKEDANALCNEMMKNDIAYRNLCDKNVKTQIQNDTPHIKWSTLSHDGKPLPAFRSVVPTGTYGNYQNVFEEGMPAAIFNLRQGSQVRFPASIVTLQVSADENNTLKASLPEKYRYDHLGFIFGSDISTTHNIGHAFGQRYTTENQRYQEDHYVYLLALEEGFCTADGIYHGSGYIRDIEKGRQGVKGTSCQEDACETGAGTYIPSERILGVRKVFKNGELGEFISNPNADVSLFNEMKQYIDTELFLSATNISDFKKIEALLNCDHPNKIENHQKIMLNYHQSDTMLKNKIQHEAKYRHNPEMQVSELVREQVEGIVKVTEGNQEYFRLFKESFTYMKSLEQKALKDAKKIFDDRKAASFEDLENRTITNYLQVKSLK